MRSKDESYSVCDYVLRQHSHITDVLEGRGAVMFGREDDLQAKIDQAIFMALDCGTNDGSHHKMWVIDQMLRILAGEDYELKVSNFEDNGLYSWDTGQAP